MRNVFLLCIIVSYVTFTALILIAKAGILIEKHTALAPQVRIVGVVTELDLFGFRF